MEIREQVNAFLFGIITVEWLNDGVCVCVCVCVCVLHGPSPNEARSAWCALFISCKISCLVSLHCSFESWLFVYVLCVLGCSNCLVS